MVSKQSPEFDPEVVPALSAWPLPPILTLEMLPAIRDEEKKEYNAETVLKGQDFTHKEFTVPSFDGYGATLSVFSPNGSSEGSRPWMYYMHAGGIIHGNRFYAIEAGFELAKQLGAVVCTIEYRLAPKDKAPAAIEDAYAGLVWVITNAEELGVDPENGLVWGSSAGGGLTAAVGLMVRDRKPAGGIKLKGLLMQYPMLENEIDEEERAFFSGENALVWSSETDVLAWKAYLGDNPENAQNPYFVPARAEDLSGLPPVFLDVGSVELFRKPTIAFAEAIWKAGGLVELHVAAGAFHGSDYLASQAAASQRSAHARNLWVTKMLAK